MLLYYILFISNRNQANGPKNKSMFLISVMRFIFNCRGEKYEQHKKHIYSTYSKQQHMCGNKSKKNPLFWVVALYARMQTSLHTSPMLSINCPVRTSLWSLPPRQLSTSTPYTHIGMLDLFFCPAQFLSLELTALNDETL